MGFCQTGRLGDGDRAVIRTEFERFVFVEDVAVVSGLVYLLELGFFFGQDGFFGQAFLETVLF